MIPQAVAYNRFEDAGMSTRTVGITTAAELLNAPVNFGRCELVRGELIMVSPGKGRHAAVAMRIGHALLDFVAASVSSRSDG